MMFLNPCSDSKPKRIRVLGAFQVLAIRTNRPAKSCKLKIKVAPRHGFEPRFTAPKAAVLPLDDRGKSALQEEVLLQCSVALRAAATICYHRSWKLILAGAGRGLQTRRAVLMCRRWVRLPLASATSIYLLSNTSKLMARFESKSESKLSQFLIPLA